MSKFNYDYSKLLMMKIGLAMPNYEANKVDVINTFEQALDIIKTMDNITCGAPKIVYLVGWQYMGHDDKYPAFFECNEALKRPKDATAKDSLLWLMKEAKKYNTIVSLHINFTDAYPDSPLWQEYIDNDLILRKKNGKLKCTGTWNNSKAYQVRYAKEFETGYFQKRFDRLCEYLPIQDAKTIHADAFFVRKGKDTTIEQEKQGRRKMIEYVMSKGIDVTSEFIYREHKSGYHAHHGKSDIIDLIPAYWHLSLYRSDITKYQASEMAGRQHPTLSKDRSLHWLIYGNVHGEDCFNQANRQSEKFQKLFATDGLVYLFLNEHKRVKLNGYFRSRSMEYTDGITTYIKNKKIIQNGKTLKCGENLCLPIAWNKGCYIAYSADSTNAEWHMANGKYNIYKVNITDKEFIQSIEVKGEKYNAKTQPHTQYYIEKIN